MLSLLAFQEKETFFILKLSKQEGKKENEGEISRRRQKEKRGYWMMVALRRLVC